ncbi:transmembrane protein 48 [Moniliophthora roreri MCA 2997]|nr:transmembrane protein 48 [Moniliophthora roreri MCA 2997]KAI3613986.1 transmembrane protein 48 [Moniliophthora roreri]
MSRTSTPVRAIPSNLSNKSAPSIPSSSQTYEPLVKASLRQRLTSRIFLLSAAFSWILACCWSVWGNGGMKGLGLGGIVSLPFRPSTISTGVVNWLTVAVPVVVLRKLYLTPSRTHASSPARTWSAAWSKINNRHALLVYCTSALFATLTSVLLSYANELHVHGDPRLTLFVKSKKHPHYLNGRLLFLVISQITMAFGFFARDVMLDRYVFRWNSLPVAFGLVEFMQTLVFTSVLTTIFVPIAAIAFVALRLVLPILFKVPIVPILLRPFMAHFLRGTWSLLLPFYHYGLLFRAWFMGFTTIAIWEFLESLFDALIPQPIRVSHLTPDPTVTLISGLSSPDRVFKFFALLELKDFASDPSSLGTSQRTEFFGNQKFSPTLWSQLCREILLLLGHDYQLLLRRGAPAPSLATQPQPSAPAPAPASQLATVPVTPKKLIDKPIFQTGKKSPIKSVIDSFAADGSFAQAIDAGAESVHVPEALKNVEDVVLKSGLEKGKGEVKKGIDGGKTLVRKAWDVLHRIVAGYVPRSLMEVLSTGQEWWTKERQSKVVEGCVPYRELDAAAVHVLSHLVCASLTEDRYGVVQRDIPKILEALLSFLTAVEEYQLELNALIKDPASDDPTPEQLMEREALRMEIEKSGEYLGVICNELKEGVGRIVRRFGDKLLAFKFPTRTARKLQGFFDYS